MYNVFDQRPFPLVCANNSGLGVRFHRNMHLSWVIDNVIFFNKYFR